MSEPSSPPKNSRRGSRRKSSVQASEPVREAFDPLTHQGPLPSPCIGVCVMDAASGLCSGCQRTIDEIIDWGVASEERKRALWLAILERRAAR